MTSASVTRADAPPPGARLVRQAARRTLLVLLALFAVAAGALSVAVHFQTESARELRASALRDHYRQAIASQERSWAEQANSLARQVEFLRYGDHEAPYDQSRIVAYARALGEHFEPYTWFLVAEERLLYAHGPLSADSAANAVALAPSMAWLWSAGTLWRLIHEPVWLGQHGKGRLVLAVPLDRVYLSQLALPDTALSLEAASGRLGPSRTLQATGALDVPWLAQARLTIDYRLDGAIATPALLAALAALMLLLAALLWIVLGRWLRRQGGRLILLDNACTAFRQDHRHSERVQHALDRAAGKDEIGDVAMTLDELMKGVDQREADHALYRETLDALSEAVIDLDASGRIRQVSNAWKTLGGESEKPTLGEYFLDEDRELLETTLARLAAGEKAQARLRLRLHHAVNPDQCHWLECRLLAAQDGVRAVFRDVTESYLAEQQITYMALHDALTGLPNRILMEDRLKLALASTSRERSRLAVMFIDLDHFKELNDSLGHKKGDELLVGFARRLSSLLRGEDTLCRWGGDEFVLLLPNLRGTEDIQTVIGKLRQSMEQPLDLDGVEYFLTFSGGAAVYPDDADTPERLLASADRAMYQAKAQGRNNVQFFGDMAGRGAKPRLYLQQLLSRALRDGSICVHYQPQVDRDGRLCGIEALARWYDDEQGWISPAVFVPMAETLGHIHRLSEIVWRSTLDDLATHPELGDVSVAINFSRQELFVPYLAENLRADAEKAGFAPSRFVFEITESVAAIENDTVRRNLRELTQAGFRLSIDDFGTGYSSLSQLHTLGVSELKIDQSFVRRLFTADGQEIVVAILSMARGLGLHTVAEGVEDAATERELIALGVDALQGYHLARPMPLDEVYGWLSRCQAAVAPERASA